MPTTDRLKGWPMTSEDADWTATYLDLLRTVLQSQNAAMLTLRDAYWKSGNERAALAVDTARNSLARALHDLRRCDATPPQSVTTP
jgi:hypothetical protein